MRHPVVDRVGGLAGELGDDPLYRASGAAMELFHSNVLAWLFRTHADAADAVAEVLGLHPDS